MAKQWTRSGQSGDKRANFFSFKGEPPTGQEQEWPARPKDNRTRGAQDPDTEFRGAASQCFFSLRDSNLVAMASNLLAMTSNLIGMASNLIAENKHIENNGKDQVSTCLKPMCVCGSSRR